MKSFAFGAALSLSGVVHGCDFTSSVNGRHLAEFDYSDGDLGPANWPDLFPTCGGNQQSPVDVPDDSDFKEEINGLIPAFGFAYDDFAGDEPEFLEFENLGKTVEVVYSGHGLKLTNAETLAFIVGRATQGVSNEYTLEQFHFHWGGNDKTGSEHTFDGKHAPMEMHLVHFNSGLYESLEEAVVSGNADAILVVAFFFEVSSTGTAALDPLVEVLQDASFKEGITVEVEGFAQKLDEMVSGVDTQNFYLYNGGLTTPGCNEIVTWVLLKDKLPISEEQLSAFQAVEGDVGKKIAPNFRPTNPGNGRIIYDAQFQRATQIGDGDSDSAAISMFSLSAFMIAAFVLFAL